MLGGSLSAVFPPAGRPVILLRRAVRSTFMEFLAYNRRTVRLVIVGAHNREHLKELIGRVGSAVLQDADCSLLIVNRQHL